MLRNVKIASSLNDSIVNMEKMETLLQVRVKGQAQKWLHISRAVIQGIKLSNFII
jgi:hypothetical protein